MTLFPRTDPIKLAVATLALTVVLIGTPMLSRAPASGATLGQLGSQLGAQQARQQSLSDSLGHLAGVIASLDGQIALVRSREAAVRAQLANDRVALAATGRALVRERKLLVGLRAQLGRARTLLSRQLLSGYEGQRPDLISVVLSAHGFADLLETLDFLHRAEQQQQSLITFTRRAKASADLASHRLTGLAASQRQITQAATLQSRALAGMNDLLATKQGALARVRAAQGAALAASRVRSGQLRSQIAGVRARQAAAARAAAAAAAAAASTTTPSAASSPTSSGPTLGPSGGWAIPYAIVLCESGGQNLPPNSAGASGYYQILPSTWKLYGGSGAAAYQAGKAEQDAVASRIWAGGSGASQWVCAGIVGIH
ncbi:MAG: transglycosylase family protein [Actinomycetota bacterium]|nr:transglycosylase family protein [Actinomycetota bacterium]